MTDAASFMTAATSSNVKVIEMMCKDIKATSKTMGLSVVLACAAPVQSISGVHHMAIVQDRVMYFTVKRCNIAVFCGRFKFGMSELWCDQNFIERLVGC